MPDEIVQLCLGEWGLWTSLQVAIVLVAGFVLGTINEYRKGKRR